MDKKVNWTTLSVLFSLVTYGVFSVNMKKTKKILLQNGLFAGIVFILIISYVKLKRMKKKKSKKKAQIIYLLNYQMALSEKVKCKKH